MDRWSMSGCRSDTWTSGIPWSCYCWWEEGANCRIPWCSGLRSPEVVTGRAFSFLFVLWTSLLKMLCSYTLILHNNRLWSAESLAVLIPSVLPAASYIYTKLSYNKLSSSPSFKSVLPSPSLAFQTTLSTFQPISSFNPFARFNYLQTFP